MNFLKNIFGKNPKDQKSGKSEQSHTTESEQGSVAPSASDKEPQIKQLSDLETKKPIVETTSPGLPLSNKRSIRVFISSTFRDMIEDRNALMTHCWPELRRFCRERQVELVEVDLRWGIAEEQSTRKETLKLCLDEIRACRPFFIGLLGERYGWVPGDDAFTADLKEEQPWLKEIQGKSVTELEILHGVLNNPEMAGRAFFYFRDPEYVKTLSDDKKSDFLSETQVDAEKQTELKALIRKTCVAKNIPLKETYNDPQSLAALVLEQLKDAIGTQFLTEDIPDPLRRETRDHEAFAESRRRTYIGRPDYYKALDDYVNGEGNPLLLLGESGCGKSALLANWVEHWRKTHPKDFIFQHYIGGTSDSSVHWKIITRLMAEIKHWTDDPEELPKTNNDILRDFTVWLAKARINAQRNGIKFIVVLDALNQLEDNDHALNLGWLQTEPFKDNLRLIVSTLPGVTLEAIEKRILPKLCIEPLKKDERGRMVVDYLKRFGKTLDNPYILRLSNETACANPLFLKILLDELRVTGTFDNLDRRLSEYLTAKDIPTLLGKVIARYQHDYEQDRKGLVKDALSFISAARRGLIETELLQLLRPKHLVQLPLATWSPLRAAMEENLLDRGGILNFAHNFLRTAVEAAFLPNLDQKDDFRIQLADYFENQTPNERNCDELPWLLYKVESFKRLRNCLLDINIFLEIILRSEDELRSYWVSFGEEKEIGKLYLDSFSKFEVKKGITIETLSFASNYLGFFLSNIANYREAEILFLKCLKYTEEFYGKNHEKVANRLNNLGLMYVHQYKFIDAESLYKRALQIFENLYGPSHSDVVKCLSNLGTLYVKFERFAEAEPILNRVIFTTEQIYGNCNSKFAEALNNFSIFLNKTKRPIEAEYHLKRALAISRGIYGDNHFLTNTILSNLTGILEDRNLIKEALINRHRVLQIDEECYGKYHPTIAIDLNNLAFLHEKNQDWKKAESYRIRALEIDMHCFGKVNIKVAGDLKLLSQNYYSNRRIDDAISLINQAIEIDIQLYGEIHPKVAMDINNLVMIRKSNTSLSELRPMLQKAVEIIVFYCRNKAESSEELQAIVKNYCGLLIDLDWNEELIRKHLGEFGLDTTRLKFN